MVLSSLSNAARFQFEPYSHSWVALHPQPKGVIQFVGSALWGTFPTLVYRHFLKSLFSAGYTVVALPFRFTLHHWSTAIDLLDEHYTLRGSMVEAAMAKGYESAVYLNAANYTWIGHGLGCKYVALLELLSSTEVLTECWQSLPPHDPSTRQLKEIQQGLSCLNARLRLMEQRIQRLTGQTVDYGLPSIMQQASLWLAPAIKVPVPAKLLRWVLSKLLTASPTVDQTHQLIAHSRLFHFTGLIQFARDRNTANTCQQLMHEQPHIRRRFLKGNHLEPVGIQLGQCVVDFNPLDKFIQPLSCRDLEFNALALVHRLRNTPAVAQQRCDETCDASTTRHRIAA